ncbi:hypothetical protein FOG48_04042 [Hanseniaspora uvarum]|nr:hypothetical protein FOG48_04042 [Hanseniaspora uvarum]
MTNNPYINTFYHCKKIIPGKTISKDNGELGSFDSTGAQTCQTFDVKTCVKDQLKSLNIDFSKNHLEEFKNKVETLIYDKNTICLKPHSSYCFDRKLFNNEEAIARLSNLSDPFLKCLKFLKQFEKSELMNIGKNDDTDMQFNQSVEKKPSKVEVPINSVSFSQCLCKYLEVSVLVIIISLKSLSNKENPTLYDLMYSMSLNPTDAVKSAALTKPSIKDESLMLKTLGPEIKSEDILDTLNQSFTQLSVKNTGEVDLPNCTIKSNVKEESLSQDRVPVWITDNMHELFFVYKSLGLKSQDTNLKLKTETVQNFLESRQPKANEHKRRKLSNHHRSIKVSNRETYKVHKKTRYLQKNICTDPYNAVVESIFDSLLHQ